MKYKEAEAFLDKNPLYDMNEIKAGGIDITEKQWKKWDKELDERIEQGKTNVVSNVVDSVVGCSNLEKLPTTEQRRVVGCSRENAIPESTPSEIKKGEDLEETPTFNNNNTSNNIATLTLPTTRYYIKSWGEHKEGELIIEQINSSTYIYNHKGKRGLATALEQKEVVNGKEETIGKGFVIGETLYLVKNGGYNANLFYNTPSISKCEQYLEGKFKPRSYKEIHTDIEKSLNQMFEFGSKIDVKTCGITIAQSWIKVLLNNFVFLGIDGSLGGGKTTAGELVYFLQRHGFVGGNISSAALVRLVDELDLNIFVDEIDQNSKDDDMMAVLRKGQRRGNPFVRCEGKDFKPKAYDLAGCHGFSYRSEIEDAFMSRSLRIHTTKTTDNRLAIINTYKKEILKSIADELFFWFLDNILELSTKTKSVFNQFNIDRNGYYNTLTKDLNEDEKAFLKEVFGRDNELSFLCIQIGKLLDLDLIESLKDIMAEKKIGEMSSEGFYLDELREYIRSNHKTILAKKLKDGDKMSSSFYPKSRLYSGFVTHLNTMKVAAIGTKKFSSLLRDLGFVEGINLKSQRYNDYPTPCLIFDLKARELIGLPSAGLEELEKVIEESL